MGHLRQVTRDLFQILISIADDHFILGHQTSKWCGHAPILEEDLSLPNMALDHLGIAQGLYDYAAKLEDGERNADDLAFLRFEHEYANLLMVEKPIGDFSFTMLREFYFSAYMHEFWKITAALNDEVVSAIAAKGIKETAYHINHAGEWVVRLADGTDESRRRLQDSIEELRDYVDEMFEVSGELQTCIEAGIFGDVDGLRRRWYDHVETVFTRGNLQMLKSKFPRSGGRQGVHEEGFGHLLAELQYMQRAYPGLSW